MSAHVPSGPASVKLNRSRLASAAAILGAALMMAPPPAVADRDDWEDGDRHRHRQHKQHNKHKHHHGHHEHGEWCAPRRYARPYVAYESHHHYAPPRRARYYCDPCDHWYGTESSFHYHVHHHHRVSRALLPAVIAATVFGAIYAGY